MSRPPAAALVEAPRVSAIPRDGLILELLFDGNGADTSGSGHHGIVHGAVPTSDRFGRAASACLFDGTDDYIAIAPPPRLSDTAFSVSVWARMDATNLAGWSNCVVCQDDGNDLDQSRRVFQLSVNDGRLVWHRMMNARDPRSHRAVRPGTWCHFVAVFGRNRHQLYIAGELQDSVKDTLRVSADEPVHVGRKGTPEPHFFFHGAIDDLRIYNRALGVDEVRALFHEGGYAQESRAGDRDPISGTWETDGGGYLDLSFDGRAGLSGTVTAGRPGNLAAVKSGTFDRGTGVVRLMGDARRPDSGELVEYVIEGKLARRRLAVSYRFGTDRGTATLRRATRWSGLRRRSKAAAAAWTLRRLEPLVIPVARFLRGLRRPSKATNQRLLRERDETLASFVFRDATPEDLPALAALHVTTWAATYPGVRRPPTYAIREWQWRETFAKADGSWFCIVIENTRGDLVGFAKGVRQETGAGDLNKIYLLGEYQRLGLGRRLVGHVVRRFLAQGITSMTLSADPANPSCGFYLALGAENPRNDRGRVDRGFFIWRDLQRLASVCPVSSPTPLEAPSPS